MSKKLFALILLGLIISSCSQAEQTLSQADFIRQAVANNPSYQLSAQDYLIALEQNKSAKSLEDWNLIISGLWNEAAPAPISSFSSLYQKTTGYTIGLEKYLAQTGTAVKLEHQNTRLEAQYPPATTIPGIGTIDLNPPSKYYLSSVSLSIVQPLWKNAWGLATKNALKMSDYSLKLAKIKLAEDWEDFIALLRSEYLIWQKCNKNVQLVKNKVSTAQDQLALVKKQTKYGLSEDLDLVQLQQKLEGYRIMLEQAKLACETQSRKILQLMGRAGASTAEFVPERLQPNHLVMDESAANAYLVSASNVKKTADILVALQTTNLETKEDAKKMDVSLVLSTKPNGFTQSFSNSLSQVGTYSDNTVTITASRPLSNDKAKAEAAEARLDHEKSIKQRTNMLLNAKIGLASLYINLKRLTNIIKLNQTSQKLAEQRLALERKKFNQGRSSIYFVLQAEDDLLQTENSLNEIVFAREEIINQIKTVTDRYLIEYKDILKI